MASPSKDRARIDRLMCAARHLAVASHQLARFHHARPEEARRYLDAEARFRSLIDGDGVTSCPAFRTSPVVLSGDGRPVPMVELLASIRERGEYPSRGIEPELVEAARQLLCEMTWRMPGGSSGPALDLGMN